MPARTTTLHGKAAVVTGGASGIGRALAALLAEAGADVVLADLDGPGAEAAASAIGGSARGVALDVRDAEAFAALVADVVDRHGRIDLLCNNAGVVLGGRTHELTAAHWRHVLDVNLQGVVNGVLAAYPTMVAQHGGQIVNTASTAGLAPAPMVVAYSASKHAVVGLSLALRPEAAREGVKVNVVCPGAVDTPILDGATVDGLAPLPSSTLTGREYMKLLGLRPVAADRFARLALRGILADRAVIAVPASARAVWTLQRTAPGLVERAGRRTVRRALAAMGVPAG
jgi:NAD(P)-dependent dehydrogenase (short-subunit alcohol dehydrogenase family)